jgi:hypothetical protein
LKLLHREGLASKKKPSTKKLICHGAPVATAPVGTTPMSFYQGHDLLVVLRRKYPGHFVGIRGRK